MDDWIECPGILTCTRAWRLKMRFGGIVNGQIVPHELGVHSYMFHEAVSAANNEVPAVVDEVAEVPQWEADAAANVEEKFAVSWASAETSAQSRIATPKNNRAGA